MAVYKNKASQKVPCYAYNPTTGLPVTGDAANITAQISIDAGTSAATNDTNPTELEATDHPGVYLFDLTQAETNADLIIVSPVSATADVQIEPLFIYTEPEVRDTNVTQFGGTNGTFASGRPEVNTTHIGGSTVSAMSAQIGVNVVAMGNNVIDASKIADNAISAAKLATDAVTEIQSGLATSAALATAQADLDILTGTDGVTLATTQANYAPATASALASLVSTVGTAGDGLTEAGGTGDHLTAIPWNASWDTEVESECNDALVALHLDHLLAATYDPASKPGAADALLNELVESDSGVSRFTVNALENGPSGSGASAEAIADAVWDEAQSGHTTAGTFGKYLDTEVSGAGGGSAADIADAVWDEATSGHTTAGTFGEQLKTDVDAILADTNELQADDYPTTLATLATAAELAKVPKSDGTATWNATALASITTQAASALTTYDPPTNTEFEARTLAAASYATASALGTAQSDLDILTGTDGVTLATTQPNYAPATSAQATTIDSNVDAILLDTAELQTDWANGGRLDLILDARASQTSVDDLPTNAELSTALGDIPTANENAAALLDLSNGIETGLTLRNAMRLIAAASAGEVDGGGTTEVTIANAVANDKTRITADVDESGNRSNINYDLT